MPAVAEKKTVFKTPVQAYDMATGELVSVDRYLNDQPTEADL